MSPQLPEAALDLLWRRARTHRAWLDRPVGDALLQRVYDLAKLGPTSANMCALRIVFVKSTAAKDRLRPCLNEGSRDLTAPVTAVLGMEVHFYEDLPRLLPHTDARSWFADLPEERLEYIALRNSSLQAAYFMLAARSLGLDCGPRSRFDPKLVNETFFAGTTVKCNFLCNLGYGDPRPLRHGRDPRLDFGEACSIL
jgi:3-hydroxypropanoate dehydrogenase